MIDDLSDAAPRSTQTGLRNLLGCFLFSEDDVFKRIGVLSGGERNRYALARMLLAPSNFLLLDEPTNHLDMQAKDVLLDALSRYSGTVVFVSHDRYFIDKLAMRIFEIEDGHVHVYPGNYEDYLWRKQGGAARQTAEIKSNLENELVGELSAVGSSRANSLKADGPAEVAENKEKESPSIPTNGNPPKQGSAESKPRRLNPIKRKQMQDRLREVEEEITRMEVAIALHETQLQTFISAEETQRQTQELAAHKGELQNLMNEWEELSEELSASH